jgi:chromosome segregation ATPase
LAGLTRSPSNESSDADQPPAAANGTYSESLTRLQRGYLMVISNLESCNKELQQEMENIVSRQRDDEARRDENAFGAQDYARLKQQHSHLQQQHYEMHEEMTNELNSLRQSNAVLQCMAAVNGNHHQTIQGRDEKIRFLQNNVLTFKDAHRRVAADLEAEKKRYANLEAANRRLAEALEAERKKDETIRTLNETNTANMLKLIQVEEVHCRLQAALKEERRKNETIRNETNKDETIKDDDGMTEDTDERINKKNATIRDKNFQINQLKEANRKLEEALKAEKRKSRAPSKTGPRAHATPTKRMSVNVGGPAQKKPKLESTSGDAHDPHFVN